MKNLCLWIGTACLATALIVPAGHAGANPKGKPFIAFNDQIIEVKGEISSLQDQIDLLRGRVNSIEEAVAADSVAIVTLQNQNDALQALVYANLSTLEGIQSEISILKQDNQNLNSQIASASGDVSDLQAQVADNNAMISSLESSLLLVQDGVISLEDSLQGQIDSNGELIAAIQDEIAILQDNIALKQNLINGVCPEGMAVRQINEDGSLVCGEAGGGVSGQLESVFVWNYIDAHTGLGAIPPGGRMTVRADCPPGYVVSGAGINAANGWDINAVYPIIHPTTGAHFTLAQAYNRNSFPSNIAGVAVCIGMAP